MITLVLQYCTATVQAQQTYLLLSIIQFWVMCTYFEMVCCIFMWSPCTLLLFHQSERPEFGDPMHATLEQIMVTFSRWLVLWEFAAQPGLWPSPKSHHRKSSYWAAGEVSSLRFPNKLHPSLVEKAQRALGGEHAVGWGEGKTALRVQETLLKAKWHLSHIQWCPSFEKEDRSLIVGGQNRKDVPNTPEGLIWINCVVLGNTDNAAFLFRLFSFVHWPYVNIQFQEGQWIELLLQLSFSFAYLCQETVWFKFLSPLMLDTLYACVPLNVISLITVFKGKGRKAWLKHV